MRKVTFQAAVMAAAVAVGTMGIAPAAMAAQSVSAAVAKPLDAANKAVKASKWDEAIAKLHEVGAVGSKTPYDTYVMNQLLSYALMKQNKFGEALPALESNLSSGLASPTEMTQMRKQLLTIYFQQKNYPKAIEVGQSLVAAGAGDDGVNNVIAQSYERQGKLGEAVKIVKARVDAANSRGGKPAENDLLQLLDYQRRLKDDKGEAESFEKLVSFYPKGDYWENVVAPLAKTTGNGDVMTLNVFRLMRSTGTLKKPSDVTEMAQLAKEQGSAGESLEVLQQAITANVFTEQREKDKNNRLLEAIKKQVASDQAALAKAEADARAATTGAADLAVARTYYGLGQYEKAAEAIKRGQAKGGITTPEEAQLLLGISLLRQKKNPEAVAAFKAIKGDPKYTKLANLWAIHAKAA
jgi:tetratricopeptide (TPR) repeat protein